MLKLQRVRDGIAGQFLDEDIVSETFLYKIYKAHGEHHEWEIF